MSTILKAGFSDIRRHRVTALITCFVGALILFTLLAFFFFEHNIRVTTKKLSNKNTIAVFPNSESSASELLEPVKAALPADARISIVDSEKMKKLLKERFPGQNILDSGDVLPEFLEVKISMADAEKAQASISKINGVEDVVWNSSWFKSIKGITSVIKYSLLWAALIFSCAGALIVFYISKISATNRKREIEVLRLCGASPFYIKLPYFASAFLTCTAGIILGFFIYYLFYILLQNTLLQFLSTWMYNISLTHVTVVHALFSVLITYAVVFLAVLVSFLKYPDEV
jgi:cell division transport system permease protein